MRKSMRAAVAAGAIAATIAGGTAAAEAAPGAGAVTERFPCTVTPPGLPTASGTGQSAVTPSGRVNFTCHAQLPAGVTLPRGVYFPGTPCSIAVAASGSVTAVCRQ